ncbi:MAG: hypothetical protein WHT81_06520 [Rectinemataceae bacterium]
MVRVSLSSILVVCCSVLIMLLCAGCALFGLQALPPVNGNPVFELQGFNICAWDRKGWSDAGLVDKALKFAIEEGANFIALDWAVNFNDDGTMVPVSESLHPRWSDMERLINRARKAGLHIMLKPHVTGADTAENRNIWNTDIANFKTDVFFPAYKAYMEDLADFAARLGVDAICIGTELNHLDTDFRSQWADLIAAVRTRFSGTIAYDALFNRNLRAVPDLAEVCFWDLVDVIGVSLYVPVTRNDDASVQEIRQGWLEALEPDIEIGDVLGYLRSIAESVGKPIMALEGGYQSVSGGLFDFSGINEEKIVNNDLQARGLDAYLGMLSENRDEWLKGVSLWELTPAMLSSKNLLTDWHTKAFSVYGKPAADVVKAYFVQ